MLNMLICVFVQAKNHRKGFLSQIDSNSQNTSIWLKTVRMGNPTQTIILVEPDLGVFMFVGLIASDFYKTI